MSQTHAQKDALLTSFTAAAVVFCGPVGHSLTESRLQWLNWAQWDELTAVIPGAGTSGFIAGCLCTLCLNDLNHCLEVILCLCLTQPCLLVLFSNCICFTINFTGEKPFRRSTVYLTVTLAWVAGAYISTNPLLNSKSIHDSHDG